MRAFQFSLGRVLGLRAYKEEQARRDLAAKVAVCLNLENKIHERQSLRALTMLENGGAALEDWMAAERYAARLLHEEARLKTEWEVAEKQLEASVQAYRKALAERKALENVKQGRLEKHRHAEKVRDTKAMDDLVSSRRRT